MHRNHEEKEVKFYLSDLPSLEKRLRALGAECIQPRTHEFNLRFDTPQRKLSQSSQVLRLRKDVHSLLTYKGPADPNSEVAARRELEVGVSNFEETRVILEALGYRVFIQYEKYRTTYHLGKTEVVLDEMPFGNFMEIEGPDSTTIKKTAEKLKLNWQAHSKLSYLALFEILRMNLKLTVKNILFKEFNQNKYSAKDFGLIASEI
ncbi:MAG TPA: class IV adenylate cyclase [Anaerolineae bacterium]|nr:class IV adenylate cyclase [Anaerolineae bacterium]